MIGERELQESRKLFVAYFATKPDLTAKLDQTGIQAAEIAKSLPMLSGDWFSEMTDNSLEIDGEDGSKLIIVNRPELQVRELKVVATDKDKLPREITEDPEKLKDLTEPYGPEVGPYSAHMMRLLMIGTGALSGGLYKPLAEAAQDGEHPARLGLKPKGGLGGILRSVGLAAVYDINPGGSNRYIVTTDKPGEGVTRGTWAELSKRFSHGTSSYTVLGRVANVGRVRPVATAS